jgi:hypothetical protein
MSTSTATIQRPIGKVGHELVIHNAGRCAHWEVPSRGMDERSYQAARISIRTYPAQVMSVVVTERGRKSAKEAWLDLNEQQVAKLREACDLALGDRVDLAAENAALAASLERLLPAYREAVKLHDPNHDNALTSAAHNALVPSRRRAA